MQGLTHGHATICSIREVAILPRTAIFGLWQSFAHPDLRLFDDEFISLILNEILYKAQLVS